ncbi:MAG TPA: FecR domain-containing protein [Pyrinomonadaceae bacterium]|nr:FecR domain-containing protein [Pyrinomonadaceae bacterium]
MILKQYNHRSLLFAICVIAFPLLTSGQEIETFEGFTSGMRPNAVKGSAFYQRGEGKFDLEPGLKLQQGDFIKTGADGYAELLLQPGNYLRVGSDSEFQIVNDQNDRMRLKLNRGSLNVEILSKDGEGSWQYPHTLGQVYELIRVITPNAEVLITEPGIFRINAIGRGQTDLVVRKGEAVINGRRAKKNERGEATGASVTVADIDAKLQDAFDVWSRERADQLVEANKSLKKDSPWVRHRKEGKETSVDLPAEEKENNSKSRYVVSARPGTMVFVEAGVEFGRANEWKPVTEKSELEPGDKLRTGPHSFAELTMLPDINLRLDHDSEIAFEQLSNDAIHLKLLRGSAILDVAKFNSKETTPITLAGASTSVVIADKGNYRIDAGPTGDEIMVRDGKVMLKDRSVGSCRRIASGTVSECEKRRSDNFDFWSDHRGEGEIYNGRSTVSMATFLDRLRRVRSRNTGFWFQNPGQTHYTFVPYTSERFRSPYGGNYSTVLSPRRARLIEVESGERPFGRFLGSPVARPPRP